MADGGNDDILQEMSKRLMPRDSTGFRICGTSRIPIEDSLRLNFKRRAPRDYKGFVDAVTLEATSSFQNRGVKVANGLVNSSEGADQNSFLRTSMKEQMELLTHTTHGPLAQQLLLTDTLPSHDYSLNIGNIAECLSADSRAVRRDAASRLERLITVSSHRNIRAFKNQLLTVAQTTHDIIQDDTWDSMPDGAEHLRACGHLHLLAMCGLLCRTNYRPSADECRPFLTWQKLDKRQTGNSVRQDLLRVMHVFCDCFQRRLRNSFSRMDVKVTRDVKTFFRADFCERLSSLFLDLNKIAVEEWSDKAIRLLANLREVCGAMAREKKRLKAEEKAGLDTLLIRSLVVLLNSTFAKVRQQVGEGSFSHPVIAAELLAVVARGVNPQQTKALLPRLSIIAFHETPEVRHIVTELLDNLRQPALHTALNYLQVSLGVADFHLNPPEAVEEACAWHTLKGRFGRKQADCHVLVHAGQCKAKRSSSGECVDHPSGQDGEDWKNKERTMEVLVKLSAAGQGAHAAAGGVHKFHSYLVQLMAFQNTPFLFYATESVQDNRLLEHLINHRAAHRWLSTSVLSHVMHDVISGLEFLASKCIASREITAYYMLVDGRSRRGGLASEKTDILTTGFTIKLTNLGLSHQFRGEQEKATVVRPVETQGLIPLLWTPQEALLKGEYSELSMVYSAGCVMYELWTHGCQPFTTYQKSTADTVREMLLQPNNTPLIRWPCIPEDVYGTMRRCTTADPHSRPSLKSLKQFFMERHTQTNETVAFNPGGKEQEYPSFTDDQVRRRHLPQLGIPPDVQQVINDYKRNRNDSYKNMRVSRWVEYVGTVPEGVTMEMSSPNWIEFAYQEKFTSVREKLPANFAQQVLPVLEKRAAQNHLRGVTTWLQDETNRPRLETESPDHIVHERKYKPSWTLLDAACKGMLTFSKSGYVDMAMDRYLRVLLSLARALHALHNASWLHRDIRACNILVDCKSGEVTLARVGRMCQVGSPLGCVYGEPFEDSWRWLGPEVLSLGKYALENDVFMFGTVVWETFWCREVTEKNPTATPVNFLPFADQPRDNILALVHQRRALKKPKACSDWLYQLAVNCRDPDPAKRPFMADVVFTLEREMIQKQETPQQFLVHPKRLVDAYDQCSAGGISLPKLPARFQTKHAVPFRDSGTYDSTMDEVAARIRPINLRSVKLEAKSSTSPEEGGAATDASTRGPDLSGYLTPASEEVRSVADARGGPSQAEEPRCPPRPFSANDKPPLPTKGLHSRKQGFPVSESALSPESQLGLTLEQKERIDPLGRGVLRPIRGYPLGRGLPLVPSEDEDEGSGYSSRPPRARRQDDDNVYDEI